MKQIKTGEEFNNIINDEGLQCIKIGASWCGPCRMLENTIAEIEPTLEGVHFYYVDVDEVDEAILERLGVQNVPIMLFFNEGLQIDRVVGARGKKELLEIIERNK